MPRSTNTPTIASGSHLVFSGSGILETLDDRHDHVGHDRVAGGDDDHAEDRQRERPPIGTDVAQQAGIEVKSGGHQGGEAARCLVQREAGRRDGRRIGWARIIAKAACRSAAEGAGSDSLARPSSPCSGGASFAGVVAIDARRGRRRSVRGAAAACGARRWPPAVACTAARASASWPTASAARSRARALAPRRLPHFGIEQRAHVRGERRHVARRRTPVRRRTPSRARPRRTWCW